MRRRSVGHGGPPFVVAAGDRNETCDLIVVGNSRTHPACTAVSSNGRAPMISELQIHTIARQMLERHGFAAIAKAAEQAQACEGRGEADEAKEWRHIEDAMKIMRGPHHS
ncbi:hypothetical protein E4K65_07110 [Bradyrhizobium niftali]|uniref:Uncharacterized protein n=2 Tax=Bradyrhizobium niftali TaxID=2560055 RepID=A0A4Y9M3Z1_9BRAD|nr:hypothetical protein E4K65_07110 [Bradyrhizobium niftali]